MKTRKLTVLILTLAMLALCACDAQPAEPTETPTNVPETTETTAPTEPPTESEPATEAPATEPTEVTTEATEVATEAPDPKEDIMYYPYPLLEMTSGEILEKYGDMVFAYYYAGGMPHYFVDQIGVMVAFSPEELRYDRSLPDPQEKVCGVIITGYNSLNEKIEPEREIYPGFTPGKVVEDFWSYEWIERNGRVQGHLNSVDEYIIDTDIDGYHVSLYYDTPSELIDLQYQNNPEAATAGMIQYMQELPNLKLKRIEIYKFPESY